MQDLEYALLQIAKRNRDGSHKTQADRRRMLRLFARQLHDLGYQQMKPGDLKGRHLNRLLALWQGQGITPGTVANRMATLRWWGEKIGKPEIFAHRNAVYGITPKGRRTEVSKAKVLSAEQLAQVDDVYIATSLQLIQAYGLRRKESLMLRPHEADGGTVLRILHNWAKNGRPREIAVTTSFQRQVLDAAKDLVRYVSASMIPAELRYVEQEKKFDAWVQKIGLGGAHGLRHTWAQARYESLSGMVCPLLGGPMWGAMTPAQQEADVEARQHLTRELGHERPSEVSTYVGSNRPLRSQHVMGNPRSE